MAKQMNAISEGHFVGIGVEILRKGKFVVVIRGRLDDSPAQRAGDTVRRYLAQNRRRRNHRPAVAPSS